MEAGLKQQIETIRDKGEITSIRLEFEHTVKAMTYTLPQSYIHLLILTVL